MPTGGMRITTLRRNTDASSTSCASTALRSGVTLTRSYRHTMPRSASREIQRQVGNLPFSHRSDLSALSGTPDDVTRQIGGVCCSRGATCAAQLPGFSRPQRAGVVPRRCVAALQPDHPAGETLLSETRWFPRTLSYPASRTETCTLASDRSRTSGRSRVPRPGPVGKLMWPSRTSMFGSTISA